MKPFPTNQPGLGGEKQRWTSEDTFFAAAAILALLTLLFVATTPDASASKKSSSQGAGTVSLNKKIKGKLPIRELTEDEAIVHALNRLGYGPRPGDVDRVRRMGLEKWIDLQLHPESIDDSDLEARLAKYPTLKMASQELLEKFPPPNLAAKQEGITKEQVRDQMQEKRRDAVSQVVDTGNENIDRANEQLARMEGPNRIVVELSMAKLDRAIYSQRQLEAVMEDFWLNHFNVFANKGDDKWLLTSYVRDTIRPHTLGKFQDLLIATAKSPAMLFFLDNWQSVDPDAFKQWQAQTASRRQFQGIFSGGFRPIPGYFPRPVVGFPAAQAAANAARQQERGINENYGREVMELHTVGVDAGYSQQDVIEMAKCLTGWTIREPRRDPEYVFRPEFHTQGAKTVMGRTFDYGGEKDGEEALKMLANDPHTAKFISTELARHFVADDPSPALVARMAKRYEKSGGDIRSVLEAMIDSPEFWSRSTYRNKVKRPLEIVASTARALNADVTVSLPLAQWVGRMGEPLFLCQPPTGYSDESTSWVNTGALLNRLNFALQLAANRMPGLNLDLSALLGEEASTDPEMALSRAVDIFLDGQIAPGTRETLQARLSDPQILRTTLGDPVKVVNEALIAGLVLGTPEFQRQ
jgi:uncharacterized protein (DUF1800 family)